MGEKKLIKKIAFTAFMIILIFTSTILVNAANIGDVVNVTLRTDIITKINNQDIASYNIDGYTVVVAEDLCEYGFDVVWNGSERALYITKNSTSPHLKSRYVTPKIEANQVGQKAFDVLYSDIKTYMDNQPVTSYNINGRTVIYFDDLNRYGNISYDNNLRTLSGQFPWLTVSPYNKLADFIIKNGYEGASSSQYILDFDSMILSHRISKYGSQPTWNVSYGEGRYRLSLSLFEDGSSEYELIDRNIPSSLDNNNIVLLGNFKNDSITYDIMSLPYNENGYDGKNVELATELLKSLLSKLSAVLPELKLADFGYVNYIDPNVKQINYADYYDASEEINSIKTYISKGMYLEAIDLCNSTLQNTNISPLCIGSIKSLLGDAQRLYEEYEKNIQKKEDQAKADEFRKLLTDSNKSKMYEECQKRIKLRLNYPLTARFTSANFSASADGIRVAVKYEAANAFGVYSSGIAVFVFNKNLRIISETI